MAGEAGMGGLSNLFQNRLFLQYLSAAGQDIGSGNPIGTNVNAVTQQNIGAQSQNKLNEHYIKMLTSILSGKVPAGGKMTMDDKGTKFQIPPPGPDSSGSQLAGVQQPNWPATPSFNPAEILNPSNSLPELSASDLAGLSSKDVSAALGGALDVQELMRRTVADAAGIPYQEAKTAEAWAHAQSLLTPKDERTELVKNYEYARDNQGFKGTLEQFKEGATTHKKDYDEAVKGGYSGSFNEWLLQMQQAGATRISIGEKVETKKALDEVAAQSGVKDPELVSKVEKKYPLADVVFDFKDEVDRLVKDYKVSIDQASAIVQKAKVREDIDGMVRQAYKDKDVKYVRGKGWYIDNELVRRDPYATQ